MVKRLTKIARIIFLLFVTLPSMVMAFIGIIGNHTDPTFSLVWIVLAASCLGVITTWTTSEEKQ